MKTKIRFILVTVILVVIVGVISIRSHESKKAIQAVDHLDDTVVTVDDRNIALSDMMFYIAYEETTVQEQARIYAPDNPGSYWNLHVDGHFMKVVARDAAMDMAVHDEIFYQLALEAKLELDDSEQELLDGREKDFWSDRSDEEIEKLGVEEEVIKEAMYRLTLAQKYQNLISEMTGNMYEAYDMDGAAYETLLEEHTVKVNDRIWDRLNFGEIVINKYE